MGHPTYILIYIGLGILFYTIKALLLDLQRYEFIVAAFLVWCFFSAGFYHAFIFFMMPTFLTLALSLTWNLTRQMAQKATSFIITPKALSLCAGFHFTGLLLASYKIIGVWRYQQNTPRSVIASDEKLSGLFELLGLQLAPLYQGKLFGIHKSQGLWNIWETSHFNLVHWVFLVIIVNLSVRWIKRRGSGINFTPQLKAVLLHLVFLAFTGMLFLAGSTLQCAFRLTQQPVSALETDVVDLKLRLLKVAIAPSEGEVDDCHGLR